MTYRTSQLKRLEFALYMYNRTKAYDFNKSKEVRECFKQSIGAMFEYMAYQHKTKILENQFETSVEFYDPVTWINMMGDISLGDKLVIETMNSMSKTSEMFCVLADREEKVCRCFLFRILNMEPDMKAYILGDVIGEKDLSIKDFIDNVFDNLVVPNDLSDQEQMYMYFIDYISEL